MAFFFCSWVLPGGFHTQLRKRKPPPGVIEGQIIPWEALVWVSQSWVRMGGGLYLSRELASWAMAAVGVGVFLRDYKVSPCVMFRV